ncbi:MAG: polysaccharide deacetylase protein, partial [uncultured bacterium]
LLAAGFTPLNLAQTRLFLAGTLENIRQPVLITFDDGYESLYHFALPVARQLKIPMTVFMITSRAGRRIQFAEYLTEFQIREMADSGYFDFGSHTHDLHTDSVAIFEAFAGHAENPVLRLLQRDLRISSARLEGVLGARPTALAWPYGKFNGEFSTIARNSGYRLHFTSVYGYNEPGANPFAIKRIPITSRDSDESVIRKASPLLR